MWKPEDGRVTKKHLGIFHMKGECYFVHSSSSMELNEGCALHLFHCFNILFKNGKVEKEYFWVIQGSP